MNIECAPASGSTGSSLRWYFTDRSTPRPSRPHRSHRSEIALPSPYSPDFNPIAKLFSNFKALLRKARRTKRRGPLAHHANASIDSRSARMRKLLPSRRQRANVNEDRFSRYAMIAGRGGGRHPICNGGRIKPAWPVQSLTHRRRGHMQPIRFVGLDVHEERIRRGFARRALSSSGATRDRFVVLLRGRSMRLRRVSTSPHILSCANS